MKNRLKTGRCTCRNFWIAGRRDSTVFGVVDDTTTTKFANHACAVHGISLPVVVDKVVVVVLKFPNVMIRTTKTVESVQLSGVVVSVVVVLKFPNITIKTTKTVESVQLNGVVVSFVVVLKFPNMTIRTTKTVESIQLKGRIKIVGCFPPFYLPLHLYYYLPKHTVLLFDSWKPFGHLQLLLS